MNGLEQTEPVNLDRLTKPVLCVHVDTEEEFDWAAPFSSDNTSVAAMSELARGHEIFRRYGLKSTYLADFPIVSDDRARDILGGFLDAGECLLGAQLHPWVTPPHEEEVGQVNSFPCNLPKELERRKLEILTETIVERFGIKPCIYKAGRYGLNLDRRDTLIDLGYTIDTSVVPYRNYQEFGHGPNFFGFPDQPFWAAASQDLFCLPVTQALIGPLSRVFPQQAYNALLGPRSHQIGVAGSLVRLGLLERITLTPEGVTAPEMCRLIDVMIERGKKVFCFSYHSPSLKPGCTPYVRDEAELKEFLYRIETVLDYFFDKIGGQAVTPLEIRDMFTDTIPV